jgi:hypothetical protein
MNNYSFKKQSFTMRLCEDVGTGCMFFSSACAPARRSMSSLRMPVVIKQETIASVTALHQQHLNFICMVFYRK